MFFQRWRFSNKVLNSLMETPVGANVVGGYNAISSSKYHSVDCTEVARVWRHLHGYKVVPVTLDTAQGPSPGNRDLARMKEENKYGQNILGLDTHAEAPVGDF